jgi:hypothetical protein
MIGVIAATLLALAPAVSPDMDLPDPLLTPGAADAALTAGIVCGGYFTTKPYRHVTKAMSERVYRDYGIADHSGYELDHLEPLEIGGASAAKNLWPQPVAEARIKDWLEDRLHDLICEGKVSQQQAQQDIAGDWIAAYRKYMPHPDKRGNP